MSSTEDGLSSILVKSEQRSTGTKCGVSGEQKAFTRLWKQKEWHTMFRSERDWREQIQSVVCPEHITSCTWLTSFFCYSPAPTFTGAKLLCRQQLQRLLLPHLSSACSPCSALGPSERALGADATERIYFCRSVNLLCFRTMGAHNGNLPFINGMPICLWHCPLLLWKKAVSLDWLRCSMSPTEQRPLWSRRHGTWHLPLETSPVWDAMWLQHNLLMNQANPSLQPANLP